GVGMRGARQRRFVAILPSHIEYEWGGLVTEGDGIGETKQQVTIACRGTSGRKASGRGQRIGAVYVNVRIVHLLSQVMGTKDLIEFAKNAGFAIGGGLIKSLFTVENELRSVGWWDEIELPVFVDIFSGREPKEFVADDRAAECSVVVPLEKIWRIALPGNAQRGARSRDIGAVEGVVTVINGSETVDVVAAGLGNHVDDAAGGMAKLGFIASGNDLKFGDGILIELSGGTAGELVFV